MDETTGTVYVAFTSTSADNDQPLKLLFHDTVVDEGDIYTLTFTLNSSVSGKITVNEVVVDIVVGTNEISVTRELPESGSGSAYNLITIQFGWKDESGNKYATEGSFEISNIEYHTVEPEKLEAPTGLTGELNENIYSVTITDNLNDGDVVASYEIGLFVGENDEPTYTYTLTETTGEIDISDVVTGGTYIVKVRAVPYSGTPYLTSDWYASDIEIVVGLSDHVDFINDGQSAAHSHPGVWYYYKTNTDVTEAYINEQTGTIYVTFSVNSSTNQPVKLFYQDDSIKEGDWYTLSFTLESPMAGYIIVNGETIAINAGTNEISVTRQLPSTSGSDYNVITIQFGATVDGNITYVQGSFVISNIEYHTVEPEELEA